MTLFTSDTERQRSCAVTGFVYLLVSLFTVLFGAVYEYYSHEVYSNYMVYAFLFPLAGGALPFVTLSIYGRMRFPGRAACNLYHSGIATLTVGSVMEGVLEIYGTTNDILRFYWLAGFGFVGVGLLVYAISLFKRK